MMGKTHILPFFIPHMGCPHQCVFCNQHHVTGQGSFPKEAEIISAINNWEGDTLPEIAFYGGSFTGLSFKWQEYFLHPAYQALQAKKISGIRISTRPDYINREVLGFLRSFGVGLVELGVQSLESEVLDRSCRGHQAEDVFSAMTLLQNEGFKVGVQLMPGLPGDTWEKSLRGAFVLARLKPDVARIYPALVLRNTPLEQMYLKGGYQPLSLKEAVDVSRDMLAVFDFYGTKVIRIGLQPTKDISLDAQVAAGPFHPAFGELVESALFKEQVTIAVQRFEKLFSGQKTEVLALHVSFRDCSLAAGHRRNNIGYFKHIFSLAKIKIVGRQDIKRGSVGVSRVGWDQPELLVSKREFLTNYVTQRLVNPD